MGLINNPVPQSLNQECKKAAKILTSFVKPNQMIRYEEVIPPHVLQNAYGLCILTVLRAGFLFSGRAGSGLIVARLPDGTWSPPSGVMTAGAGTGGMIGADLTDFIFVLNSPEAVKTFASAGTLQLGGNISLAAGPLGRAGEAGGAAGTSGVATVFSYSKSKGLYAGISLEGSVLLERKDANQKFYGRSISAKQILSGRIAAPRSVQPLFNILDSRAFRNDIGADDMDDDFYDDMPNESDYDNMSTYSSRTGGGGRGRASGRFADEYEDDYEDDYVPSSRRRGGGASRLGGRSSAYDDDYDDDYEPSGRRSGAPSSSRRSGRYADDYDYDDYDAPRSRSSRREYTDDYDDYAPRRRRDDDYDDYPQSKAPSKPAPKPPKTPGTVTQGIALYSYGGEEDGDLAFKKGDVINITAKSDSTDDWWTGELNGKKGIFPANYIELV